MASEIAQWVKTLAELAWQPEFDPQNSHKGVERTNSTKLFDFHTCIPRQCPHTPYIIHMNVYTHTNDDYDDDNKLR